MESRRVRMLSRTDSAVALALVQRQEEDAAAARAEQAEWATYTHMVRKRSAVEADVDDVCKQLKKVRQNLAAMESLKECQEAMKSFSPASLGHGNKRGGTKAQAKIRMEVLERVARQCGALSPEQTNDWKWFKDAWDQNRANAHGPEWGLIFAETMQGFSRTRQMARQTQCPNSCTGRRRSTSWAARYSASDDAQRAHLRGRGAPSN